MEEDIKILESLWLEDDFQWGLYDMNINVIDSNRVLQAIENLIKQYKKLEEERDNLIIQKNADYYKISKLKDDLDEVEGDRDYNYIPKSKVREKITQIKMKADYDWLYKYDYQDVTKILEELLQEGDK